MQPFALSSLLALVSLTPNQSISLLTPKESVFKEVDISSSITSLSNLICDTTSVEPVEFRKVIHHTAKSGQESILVFFTIEGQGGGGNMYVQYLAVFSCLNYGTDRLGYRPSLVDFTIIGGKLIREINTGSVRISEKGQTLTIDVDILEYGPSDSAAAPSVPGKARFTITTVPGGKISEVQTIPRKTSHHKKTP